jgi:hypothetical protein
MLGPLDYVIWLCGFALAAFVVVRAVAARDFFRYFLLNFYMLAVVLVTGFQFCAYQAYGFTSVQYVYAYYWGDSLETVFLYFAIIGMYQLVFGELGLTKYVRVAAVLLLGGTALFSYLVVSQHSDKLAGRFVVGLSQNLYFVGVVLTYLLWGAVLKLRETRTRIIQLALSLGVYFSAYSATYALRNLFPNFEVLKLIPPIVGTWLPLSWAYTFTKIPEEARLATAQVATPHR